MTLNVYNIHLWMTHIPAVAYSLSQSCPWLSPVTQTKLTKLAFGKTLTLPPNLIIQ